MIISRKSSGFFQLDITPLNILGWLSYLGIAGDSGKCSQLALVHCVYLPHYCHAISCLNQSAELQAQDIRI